MSAEMCAKSIIAVKQEDARRRLRGMCGAQCVAMGGYVLLYVAKWPCVTTCEPVSGTSHYGSVVRSHSIPWLVRSPADHY